MNRVLCYFNSCGCERKRRRDEHLDVLVKDLREQTGKVVRLFHEDGEIHASIHLVAEPISDFDHAGELVAKELRDAIEQLTAAADRLEAGLGEAEGLKGGAA